MAAMPSIPAPPATLRLLSAPPPPPTREPEWVERSWQAARREVERYGRTAWAFARAPRETAHLWAEGRFDAQNPLGFLLNTVAIIGPWRALWQRILGLPEMSLGYELIYALAPFLGVVGTGSYLHVLFLLLGRSKRRITSTWAISIYASGAVGVLCQLITAPCALIASNAKTPEQMRAHLLAIVVSEVLIVPLVIWQTLALAGLHGLRRRRAAFIQVIGTIALTAMALGLVMEFVTVLRLVRHAHL